MAFLLTTQPLQLLMTSAARGPRPPAHPPSPRPPSPLRPAEEALLSEMAEGRRSHFLAFAVSGEQTTTSHPREQKHKMSRRLQTHTSQRLAEAALQPHLGYC